MSVAHSVTTWMVVLGKKDECRMAGGVASEEEGGRKGVDSSTRCCCCCFFLIAGRCLRRGYHWGMMIRGLVRILALLWARGGGKGGGSTCKKTVPFCWTCGNWICYTVMPAFVQVHHAGR